MDVKENLPLKILKLLKICESLEMSVILDIYNTCMQLYKFDRLRKKSY